MHIQLTTAEKKFGQISLSFYLWDISIKQHRSYFTVSRTIDNEFSYSTNIIVSYYCVGNLLMTNSDITKTLIKGMNHIINHHMHVFHSDQYGYNKT